MEEEKSFVTIKKLKGFLPSPEDALNVIAPPYDVLNSEEALKMAEGNPKHFLHVNKPEIDLPADIDPYDEKVYHKGAENLKLFVEKGYIKEDELERIYIYRMKWMDHVQYAIICKSFIKDYEEGRMKKHELTRADKEADRTKIVRIQNANAGPVFLTYRKRAEIDEKVDSIVKSTEPYIKVTTDDGIEHWLWRMTESDSDFVVDEFKKVPCTYIADGHHRAASAFNVGKDRRDQAIKEGKAVTGDEDFNYFLTLIVPQDQLKILDYNRVIKKSYRDDQGKELVLGEFLDKLKGSYEIEVYPEGADVKPKEKFVHSLYIMDKWHKLTLKPEFRLLDDPVRSLDVQVLTDNVLDPILGIKDLRKDKRIDFVGGMRGMGELEKRCKADGLFAFALFPVGMEEFLKVPDQGQIMPPKTTWFEPKARSGLVVNILK